MKRIPEDTSRFTKRESIPVRVGTSTGAVLGCLAPETTEPAHPALDSHDGVSLLPYLLGSAPAPRSWAAAEIGGSRVVLTKACALEAANALLHSAEGRLYLVPSDERCEASVRRPVLDEAIRAQTRAKSLKVAGIVFASFAKSREISFPVFFRTSILGHDGSVF